MMNEASRQAYRAGILSGNFSTKAAKIYNYLKEQVEPKSRRQIAVGTGIEIGCVTARVRELDDADLVTELDDLVKCPTTGQSVSVLIV